GRRADGGSASGITPETGRGAKGTVTKPSLHERLAARDCPQKRVRLGIARRIRRKTYITTGEAEDAYGLVCEEFREKRRAHTQFWKYLQDLDAMGLIDAKKSGEGVVGKTTMISLPGIPAKLLSDNIEAMLKRRRSIQ